MPADPDRGRPLPTSPFVLPERLSAKADPVLIARDQRQFAAISASLDEQIGMVAGRLESALKGPARGGQQALDRDQEVHRLTGQLRVLRRFGVDLCLGRIVRADDPEPVYIGRTGLTDSTGTRLLVDWRTQAAEPFFAATHAHPMGLASRRRYHWIDRRVTDYWDEAFGDAVAAGTVALDDDSAFIASLGGSRSAQMRDVLGTLQADQDAIIRASSHGALVVDGGPGTGKTVVALHRAAYLLHADPRLGHRRGGLLFVGPHEPYLAYVSDVLPSLGEEGVLTATLRDLVPEGAAAEAEPDPELARLKASADMADAIETAVALYEEPPTGGTLVETPWADIWLSTDDWMSALGAVEPGTPHNEARPQILAALQTMVLDRHDAAVPRDQLRRELDADGGLARALQRVWPLLEAPDIVGDLWTVPAYLRRCAPWLTPDQVRALQRSDAHAWTVADLPLLDAARHRLGDPMAERRAKRAQAEVAAARERMDQVVADLIAADDSEMLVMTMLRGDDLRNALEDGPGQARTTPDRLAGPFAHIVVDEAQELTDAQWQMLLRRCPSRSVTIVGDRAQARHGFAKTWSERLARIGVGAARVATLTINYRTPVEVMAEAEPVIRAALPDANVPTSIRSTGVPVRRGAASQRDAILAEWLAEHADGIGCVIGDPTFAGSSRIRSLSPELAKGLEFDLVVLVDPEAFGAGIEGAVDRYVAMTRATQQLAVLTNR